MSSSTSGGAVGQQDQRQEPVVEHDRDEQQFRVIVDGRVAGFADYTTDGTTMVFTHTVVKSAFEGKGLGTALVRSALETARAGGHLVVPQCSFVRRFVAQHPGYQDLIRKGF